MRYRKIVAKIKALTEVLLMILTACGFLFSGMATNVAKTAFTQAWKSATTMLSAVPNPITAYTKKLEKEAAKKALPRP